MPPVGVMTITIRTVKMRIITTIMIIMILMFNFTLKMIHITMDIRMTVKLLPRPRRISIGRAVSQFATPIFEHRSNVFYLIPITFISLSESKW